ncbi:MULTISPECIES: exodeoxyribonuclease VII large subunit [unclassified Microbacterium]|uniref:exodeoxyribonuclease VII large subunit n=1 Tax=unclassified Microbacterium TaxID=2609290 RepID=UPI00214AE02A|nr:MULTISPECIES: exodeoxyribonuclease VII large subunit [unclassified Microbacterium]MCR2784370.1 exodeoxyribonuclease VII large subunit [Microbacterium sp. zg.B96]WIM14812.1 exodeoxyribonuclease VII large subunit [Microbacterium sp. zg-B96]
MTTFEPAPGQTPPADAVHPGSSSPEAPTSVSRLNETIRDFVQKWGAVWVEGEITSWNVRGGNVFGRLKDVSSDASLSFRLWSTTRQRIPSDIKSGDHVVACVKSEFYVKTGDFSFIVSAMKHVGLGDQLEKLERLRTKLRAEGLFDASRKRPLPFLPHRIGLITGERSDAEKDVHRNAELRWPAVSFRTIHVAVQGERCVPETVAALQQLDADPEVDVIVIARGGGDPQTLLGFSDEALLRAVAAASTPVVSAIGHENDHPLLDDVADLRASTPTDAAKRIVPDVAEQRAVVRQLRSRAGSRLTQRIGHDIAQLQQLRSRPVLREPETMLTSRAQELWFHTSRGREIVERRVDAAMRATSELRASLRALSPAATLSRGYAIAHLPAGVIVRDAAQAPAGTEVTVTVGRGSFTADSQGEVLESATAGLPEGAN